MNKETLRELVKSYFNLTEAPVEAPVKETFAQAELIDGTVVKTDGEGGFEVGQKAYVIDSEGQEVTAPEGEHILKDDTVLVINSEGLITGVKTKDEAGEGSLEEMSAEDVAEEVIEEAISEGMTPGDVIEAVKAVIDEVVMPELESMKAKMQEYEMAYKEKMSEPAALSAQERKFAAIEKVKANKGEGLKFNAREAQLESIIKKAKKQTTN